MYSGGKCNKELFELLIFFSYKDIRLMDSCLIYYIIQITQGLKVYKLDWMSVWRFVVPHRDPSLLPRQWRIALGTQRSYKQDATKKEKRRLYESRRRKSKSAELGNWQVGSEKEVCYPFKLEYLHGHLVLHIFLFILYNIILSFRWIRNTV
jgi:hypothetical protein